jgi:hypothetical protein
MTKKLGIRDDAPDPFETRQFARAVAAKVVRHSCALSQPP